MIFCYIIISNYRLYVRLFIVVCMCVSVERVFLPSLSASVFMLPRVCPVKFYAETAESYADKIVPEAEVRVTCARVCMCVRTSHCGNIRKSA